MKIKAAAGRLGTWATTMLLPFIHRQVSNDKSFIWKYFLNLSVTRQSFLLKHWRKVQRNLHLGN